MNTVRGGAKPARLAFIDNLRWLMIALVVSMHAAVTYSHLGSWYIKEDPRPGTAVTTIFAVYQTSLQAFFMGFLFFIAGYFVPEAFDSKGPRRFLRDRAIRLGIPTVFFMLAIRPVVVYWLLYDYYQITGPRLDAYLHYLGDPLRVLDSSGPMWFTFALLIFSLVYTGVRVARPVLPPAGGVPGHREVIALALLMGVCTFLVRIVQPIGTNVMNMQLCFFSQYILLFWAGIRARRRDWLMRIPHSFGMRWLLIALIPIEIAWAGFLTKVISSGTLERITGGLTWQSAIFCFWESFFCLGVCLGLIVIFRDRFNYQDRVARWLSDNCFAVYVFHTPLLIWVTLMIRGYEAPKLVKFTWATVLGCAVTWLASSLIFRRIPLLRRVLN